MCANCHQENGEGLKGLVPPLAKSDYLAAHRSKLSCVLKRGLKGNIVVNGVTYGTQEMLGNKDLTEFEIANVMNYIGTSWGNSEKLWMVDEVRDGLKSCEWKINGLVKSLIISGQDYMILQIYMIC